MMMSATGRMAAEPDDVCRCVISAKVDGVSFEVDRNKLDDMDMLELLYDMTEAKERLDDGDGGEQEAMVAVIRFARNFFGKRQWNRIKKELRNVESEEPHAIRCLSFVMDAINAAAGELGCDAKN